jgi:hypothetical protein
MYINNGLVHLTRKTKEKKMSSPELTFQELLVHLNKSGCSQKEKEVLVDLFAENWSSKNPSPTINQALPWHNCWNQTLHQHLVSTLEKIAVNNNPFQYALEMSEESKCGQLAMLALFEILAPHPNRLEFHTLKRELPADVPQKKIAYMMLLIFLFSTRKAKTGLELIHEYLETQ